MVRATFVLSRVPVIKFRKGGLGGSSGGHAAAAPSASPPAPNQPSVSTAPSAASMSTAISDVNLPLRYRRQPMSQEEMDHINGGGIV